LQKPLVNLRALQDKPRLVRIIRILKKYIWRLATMNISTYGDDFCLYLVVRDYGLPLAMNSPAVHLEV